MTETSSPPAGRERWLDRGAAWAPALGAFALHLANLPGYGVFRDELYYIACGRRPAWGYVDHPPLVAWTAWLVGAVAGESHLALRVLAAAAIAATAWIAGRIARALGGGRFAQGLAGLGVASAPVLLALGSIYSMNAFDVLFWGLLWWVLATLLAGAPQRRWLAFGLIAGVGLLGKISVLFLGFGTVVGLVVARGLAPFRSRWIWLGGALAAALFLPHLVWQQLHGWPTLEFMANARTEKMVALPVTGFLASTLLDTAPVAWLWIAGVVWLLVARATREFRALGVAFLVVAALLATTGGKPYYLAAAYSAPLAAGAVAVERWTARARRLRLALPVAVACLGLALAPLAMPLLPEDDYVRYAAALGVEPGTDERNEVARLPQFFADMHGWRGLAEAVGRVAHALPEEERAAACVFGQNYGEAAAIEYFGPELGLPPAISAHNSYWIWGPGGCRGTLLVIGDDRERLDELFESVEPGGVFRCRDCMPYEDGRRVWVVRRPKVPVDALWPEIKHFI